MHVVQFFKSDHSEPSGGRLNFEVFTVFIMHDFVCVHAGFSETVGWISIWFCTTIM